MSEPWYDPNYFGWIPGAALGVAGGIWGSLAGILGSKGKGTRLIWGCYWVLICLGTGCLVAAIVALIQVQPYGVWYGLLLPGVLAVVVIAPLGIVVRRGQRLAEQRRMQAQDLS